jgi:hypothetical protein
VGKKKVFIIRMSAPREYYAAFERPNLALPGGVPSP